MLQVVDLPNTVNVLNLIPLTEALAIIIEFYNAQDVDNSSFLSAIASVSISDKSSLYLHPELFPLQDSATFTA